MPRKKRRPDFSREIVALGVVAILAWQFVPGFRPMVIGIGILAALLAAGFIGFRVYRNSRNAPATPSTSAPSPPSHDALVCDAPSLPELASCGGDNFSCAAPVRPAKTTIPGRTQAGDQLARQLRAIDWFQFEKLIEALYAKLGFTVTRSGGANPDGGVDLILERDGFRSAVQCKHWRSWDVGVRQVREFLGALTDQGISHGKLITSRGFTAEAKALADKHGIEIIDEAVLLKMLRAADAAYDPAFQVLLNDQRKFCPKCEREMVLRTVARGQNAGSQFWGCSGYPVCTFTLPSGGAAR